MRYAALTSADARTICDALTAGKHLDRPACLNFLCMQDVVALGDYDGVVTQLHTPTGHNIWQADDHDGARWALMLHLQSCL